MILRSEPLNKIMIVFLLSLFSISSLMAQKHKKYTRQGNRDYSDEKYSDSEILYRRAVDENPSYSKAVFNLGDALYKQEKYDDAAESFSTLADKGMNDKNISQSYYNLGNSLLKSNKIEESIEAYKNSLRNDPSNIKAKYNLAYAQDLLQQQQEQQQQQNKDDQKNKDQQGDNQDQNENEQQDKQEDTGDNQDQKQQPQQQQQQQMTKEDAERLLQALAENEKEVQEKVREEKAAKARIKTLKNW